MFIFNRHTLLYKFDLTRVNCVKNKNLEIKENLTGKNQENDTFYKSAVERERVCVCVSVCERGCIEMFKQISIVYTKTR